MSLLLDAKEKRSHDIPRLCGMCPSSIMRKRLCAEHSRLAGGLRASRGPSKSYLKTCYLVGWSSTGIFLVGLVWHAVGPAILVRSKKQEETSRSFGVLVLGSVTCTSGPGWQQQLQADARYSMYFSSGSLVDILCPSKAEQVI